MDLQRAIIAFVLTTYILIFTIGGIILYNYEAACRLRILIVDVERVVMTIMSTSVTIFGAGIYVCGVYGMIRIVTDDETPVINREWVDHRAG